MHSANRRRTRSCGFDLEQIIGECGGKINPTVDNVSKQSNAFQPLKTSKAGRHLNILEESPNNANGNRHLHGGMMVNGNGISNRFSGEEYRSTPETGKKRSNNKSSGSHSTLVLGLPGNKQCETRRSRMSAMSSKRLGGGGERNVLVSSHKGAQKSEEADVISTPVDRPKKRKKSMKKRKVREDDEYTRIKKKLRYLLKRISYEQNLIDAYSLEGWKGSSLEKLRPEKELERATKEILRCKVRIRDLFQHLDTLCAEGSLPESLFDSDGEISSEDIFCAKCGSKDVSLDNDIILCDGFCDRGFHQYCVEPPLKKEDIPPDDESWLCPACDCKDDILDLLNDSLGTKLSVSDSWEKVFPEAAVAMAGGDPNLNCDLPSDDSDDEEYDPDGLNDDEVGSDDNDESENEDGSSDESDFTSASDEMIGSFKSKDIMDLPSEDSEDDDYDPDALALDEEDKKQGSSNSDCTTDSENIETSFKGNKSNQLDEVAPRGRKKSHLPDVSISESVAGGDEGLAEVSGRRNVERLDYKKLYDEEYENVPSSSSDDEDWDKTAGNEDYESADDKDTVPLKQPSKAEEKRDTVPLKQSSKAEEKKKPRQKSKRENKKDTLKATKETPGENGEKSSSSADKQSDLRTQRLFKSFQENRYPDNTTKESLAEELQMTVTQVNNWFKYRRVSTSKTMVSKGDVEKLKTGKQGERKKSVSGSSKRTKEIESAAELKSKASKSTNMGSRKRRRR